MGDQTPETPYKVTERDLAGRPLVDLLEEPIAAFGDLLEGESFPSRDVLEALDRVLRHHVVQTVRRELDKQSWEKLVKEIRRLVPHSRRAELDRCERPWAARWAAYADIIVTAEPRDESEDELPTHGDRILKEVRNHPGISQEALLTKVGLRPQNLSRVLGLMEARRFIKREMRGSRKFLYLNDRGLAIVEEY